jgi:tetratricopeptide (TPR) repeat protein
VADLAPGDGTRNELSGTAGVAVQGRDFHGINIHLRHADSQAPTPRQLPRDITYFTGRSNEMASLDTLIADVKSDAAAAVIVSLIAGTAGVGKTALAVHWGHRVRNHFPGGDLYVNLQGYGPEPPLTPSQCLEGFLTVMGILPERIPREVEMRAAMFRTLLDERRMLIILDNAGSAEQVRPFLPGSPGSLVVVTSRSRLPGLIARDGARPINLSMLAADDANTLLGKIVGTRITVEPQAASRIVRSCAHLPLALRIAAEYAVTHPQQALADLAQALAEERDRLDIVSPSGDNTTAVRSVFSWSYRVLRPELARAFRLLGLHTGPDISVGAAAALIGTNMAAGSKLIDELCAVHLIEEPIAGRYRFHDLLRAYAAERAYADELSSARTEAVEHMLFWYLHAASAVRSMISAPRPQSPFTLPVTFGLPPVSVPVFSNQKEALSWGDAELSNLVTAVQQAVDMGRHDIACWLPIMLHPYFQRRALAPWYDTHIIGLAAAVAINDTQAEAELHRGIGCALSYQGRHEEAFEHHRQALDGYRRIGWEEEILLVNMGDVCDALHRYDESFDYLHQAVAISRRTGYRSAEGFALLNLAATCQSLGRFVESSDYCRDAIIAFRDTDNIFGLGIVLILMAYSYLQRGELSDATDYLNQALRNAREIDHQPREAWVLEALGAVAYHIGQRDAAAEAWQNSLKIYEKLLDNENATRVRTQISSPDIPPTIPRPRS